MKFNMALVCTLLSYLSTTFERAELGPGESKRVSCHLDDSSFSFYDPALQEWRMEAGEFEILAGSSSRDIRLWKTIDVH